MPPAIAVPKDNMTVTSPPGVDGMHPIALHVPPVEAQDTQSLLSLANLQTLVIAPDRAAGSEQGIFGTTS
jgi:hypothetical protein